MRQISEEKKERMLTENIRTLIPSMAVPTIAVIGSLIGAGACSYISRLEVLF